MGAWPPRGLPIIRHRLLSLPTVALPGPWGVFRNTYLLHDIGAASPVAPDFFETQEGEPVLLFGPGAPLSCPATRRDSNGLASARPAGVNTPHSCPGLALQFRDSEFAGFSFKNQAPMTFCKAVKRRGQPGAVENPGNPPSCGASIGGVPRFMGVR